MNPAASSSRKIRTGLFEIDLDSGQMHKNGRRLPLQEQPFRVLAMLLERPGEVVARRERQARLWPSDTYVGFDEGLNTAIRKLRTAFGDSAANPRFIETLPRRGYRFIAPLSATSTEIGFLGTDAAVDPVPRQQDAQPASTPDNAAFSAEVRRWPWKTVAAAAAALVLVVAVTAYLVGTHPSPGPQKRTMLAVLPFQNLSNDPRQEYFSDGLTEETITDLGRLSPEHLGVIARTSTMAYKHTNKTVSQIGHELDVDYVLEGSVRREGGEARVSAQLIRVSDQTHLWAENYERELHDLLEIENELGRAIARQVQINLTRQQETDFSKARLVNPEAYDLYLKGRFYWNQRTQAGFWRAIASFKQAIEKD